MSNSLYRPTDFGRELPVPIRPVVGVEKYRSEARRDKARLIHSAAFRRLQGKTQLFPGIDSDFFRNRLTHSIEVAQIAESIAHALNDGDDFLKSNPIDPQICIVASLAHDLGHPPFGHNGEMALDDCMKGYGGFEGNAQTLRILCRLEKKQAADALPYGVNERGIDRRAGLNLCYRTLAGALKYDQRIPVVRDEGEPLVKGYYDCDKDVVGRIRKNVAGKNVKDGAFRTIECSIMDIADDIAYSTYDLEDAFKHRFLTPLEILTSDDGLRDRVAKIVAKNIGIRFTKDDVMNVLYEIFKPIIPTKLRGRGQVAIANAVLESTYWSMQWATNGYARTDLTAELISAFIGGVRFERSKDSSVPALGRAVLKDEIKLKIEVLKRFNYEATIMSPRLKITEHRGYQIVKDIFKSLTAPKGAYLLPEDFHEVHDRFNNAADKHRVICDFICGMTDRYAVEFYARLHSEQPQSIFKPL